MKPACRRVARSHLGPARSALRRRARTDALSLDDVDEPFAPPETEPHRRFEREERSGRLRDALSRPEAGQILTSEAEAARAMVINIVNNFFYDRLTGMPSIKVYMEGFNPPAG